MFEAFIITKHLETSSYVIMSIGTRTVDMSYPSNILMIKDQLLKVSFEYLSDLAHVQNKICAK